MKTKVLLIDDSLTVQKVVALSLDRSRYQVLFAKSASEAIRSISENDLSVVLVSDSVSGLAASSFPKEVELRLGRERKTPPMVLISPKADADSKHYAYVLQKPFTPQSLASAIESLDSVPAIEEVPAEGTDEFQQIFNNAFPDESALTKETLRVADESAAKWGETAVNYGVKTGEVPAPLWDNPREMTMRSISGRPISENPKQNKLMNSPEDQVPPMPSSDEIEDRVSRKLDQMLPGIVERLVQARLDKLLKEKEESR